MGYLLYIYISHQSYYMKKIEINDENDTCRTHAYKNYWLEEMFYLIKIVFEINAQISSQQQMMSLNFNKVTSAV